MFRPRRAFWRIARRCAAVVVAVALVACIARAGTRSFYCPYMGTFASEHCCATRAPERVRTLDCPDCCEVRTSRALPAARTIAPAPDVPPASFAPVAVLPIACASTSTAIVRVDVARGGRSPPPAVRSLQLVVLRI